MIRLVLVAGALLAALTACGAPETIPKDDFARRAADVYCDRLRECDRGSFESGYFGMSDCHASIERFQASLVSDFDDNECEYDAKKAADLFVKVGDMSCENFYEGEYQEDAAEIWDCD